MRFRSVNLWLNALLAAATPVWLASAQQAPAAIAIPPAAISVPPAATSVPPTATSAPTAAQIHDQVQPPGYDVVHPGRTPGQQPRQGLRGEASIDTASAPTDPDVSSEASPLGSGSLMRPAGAAGGLRIGTSIAVQMAADVSSGHERNGDLVEGVLAEPLRLANGKVLSKGARVTATIVSSARAGTIQSGGVLSLQLVRVAAVPVVSDVLAFDGKEGHKDVADSFPDKGTEATVAAGTVLHFRVTT